MPAETNTRPSDLPLALPPPEAAAHTGEYLYSQLIPYIGNKRKLLPLIADAAKATHLSGGVFVDLFAGSGVVSRYAKMRGFRVISNDWEPYAYEINNCFVGLNRAPEFTRLGGAPRVLSALKTLGSAKGYIAQNYCPESDDRPEPERERLFFTRANGGRIDAVRDRIEEWRRRGDIDEAEQSYLLAPLLFAASYVSNTSGLFKAFHHGWGGRTGTALYRILSDLQIRAPVLLDNGEANETWRMDAQLAAEELRDRSFRPDIVYLDPPYNQHPYGSNYHLLNTIAQWDKPDVAPVVLGGGKSAIRTDWRDLRRSAYNSRRDASRAYQQLLATLDARAILTSYSTDGTIPLRELLEISAGAGRLGCVLAPYKRYRVSAQRRSRKPVNVEFVLIVNKDQRAGRGDAKRCLEQIMRAESEALRCHPELRPA